MTSEDFCSVKVWLHILSEDFYSAKVLLHILSCTAICCSSIKKSNFMIDRKPMCPKIMPWKTRFVFMRQNGLSGYISLWRRPEKVWFLTNLVSWMFKSRYTWLLFPPEHSVLELSFTSLLPKGWFPSYSTPYSVRSPFLSLDGNLIFCV